MADNIIPIVIEHHDDIIKWKQFPHYWPFVWGIHWSLVNSPHKGQWHRVLMFSLIWAWIDGWVNNGSACDLRCHFHYDVTIMKLFHYAIFVIQTGCRWIHIGMMRVHHRKIIEMIMLHPVLYYCIFTWWLAKNISWSWIWLVPMWYFERICTCFYWQPEG